MSSPDRLPRETSGQKNQGCIHFLTIFSLQNWEIKELPLVGQLLFLIQFCKENT